MNDNSQQYVPELRAVVTRLIKKLRKESTTAQHLSLTERSTITLLNQYKQLLPSELAAMEKITNQSMSQILNHLLELGYIMRTASETDKRKVIISLTSEGEAVLMAVRSEREEWLNKAIASTCSEEEIEILKKAIIPLAKIVDFE